MGPGSAPTRPLWRGPGPLGELVWGEACAQTRPHLHSSCCLLPGPQQPPTARQAGSVDGLWKTETDPATPWPGPGGPEAVLLWWPRPAFSSPFLLSHPRSLPGFACWSDFPLALSSSCRPTLGVTRPLACPRGPPSPPRPPWAAPPHRVPDGPRLSPVDTPLS